MYKSVFAKYITTFMLIIIVSFIILAAIISSMMQGYSHESTQDILGRSARNVKLYVESGYNMSDADSYTEYIRVRQSDIMRDISTLALFTSDSIIFLTDSNGRILMTNSALSGDRVDEENFDRLLLFGEASGTDTLGGLFDGQFMYYALPVYADDMELVGTVFVCSSAESLNELVEVMIKTIIMASLWVMLAALIAVYFITEKIIGPIKDMGKAAKAFAAGRFDVRVPVIGRDEIAELAVAFNNMASSLASNEEMRRNFLANVSHDLRTPMFTIGGFIDGILTGAIPPEKQDYYLQIIAQEVRRLSRLVSSLLDITRIQAGDRKFVKTPFDICEMARQILISFEQKIDAKKLDVDFDCDDDKMFVFADHDAIYQILYNICDNAVKFSREGGKYRIGLHIKDKRVYVSVYNEGQGISANDLPYVFDHFYKADKSRGLDKTGTGLGLFIAKTIVDAHDEEIWVKSEEGKFCEFTFTLKQTTEQAFKQYIESEKDKDNKDKS